MHISEGVLSGPALIAGALIAAGGVAAGMRRLNNEKVPEVALLTAAFFVASLIHIPLGPTSIHLVLNGLLGLLLGWMVFPAVFTALALQALFFQFGGFTTLGVNTCIMALPGLACYLLFQRAALQGGYRLTVVCGFAAGMTGVAGAVLLLSLALAATGDMFNSVAWATALSCVPLMVVEGVATSFCLTFLKKVKPEILEAHR